MNAADLELIQRELDDENAPEERERLQALLERDAEARGLFHDLKMVVNELGDLPLADPPPRLRANVMDALTDGQRARNSRVKAAIQALRDALSARPALAYGYAFGTGLLAGVALFALVDGQRMSSDNLYGAFVPNGVTSESAGTYESIVELPGFAASVRVYATAALLVVDLDVDAEELTDVRLVPVGDLMLKGLTHQTGTTAMSVETSGSTVDLHVSGADRYLVLFERPDGPLPPIRVEIWRNGEQLHAESAQTES